VFYSLYQLNGMLVFYSLFQLNGILVFYSLFQLNGMLVFYSLFQLNGILVFYSLFQLNGVLPPVDLVDLSDKFNRISALITGWAQSPPEFTLPASWMNESFWLQLLDDYAKARQDPATISTE
jgi:hypothetical protein